MPCPFFEPQGVAADPEYPHVRLPLLDEYDGLCHAAEPLHAPPELRFGCCNHGYSRGTCTHFPASETRSCIRFDVLHCDAESLELLFVEERDHAPLTWRRFRYFLGTGVIDPDPPDICARAQVVAFSKSYLSRWGKTIVFSGP